LIDRGAQEDPSIYEHMHCLTIYAWVEIELQQRLEYLQILSYYLSHKLCD